MDPTANLKEQIQLACDIQRDVDKLDRELTPLECKANALGDLVVALNDWIRNGGFLPVQWAGRKG